MTNNDPVEPDVVLDLTAEDVEDLAGEDIKVVGPERYGTIATEVERQPELEGANPEVTRSQLAKGLLLILASALAGVFVFIGFGQLDGLVLTQSIFPSLVGLAGTALGFYFGAETRSGSSSS